MVGPLRGGDHYEKTLLLYDFFFKLPEPHEILHIMFSACQYRSTEKFYETYLLKILNSHRGRIRSANLQLFENPMSMAGVGACF